jgi:hypothetical protein
MARVRKAAADKVSGLSKGYTDCLREINAFLKGGPCGAQVLKGCYKTLFRHFAVRGAEAADLRRYMRDRSPQDYE